MKKTIALTLFLFTSLVSFSQTWYAGGYSYTNADQEVFTISRDENEQPGTSYFRIYNNSKVIEFRASTFKYLNDAHTDSFELNFDKFNKLRLIGTALDSAKLSLVQFAAKKCTFFDSTDVVHFKTAYSWGNHADAGYLTSYTETDPNFNTNFSSKTTTDLGEGTNQYWTNGRFDVRLATKTTSDLTEGSNLYFTSGRFNTAFAGKSTTDLSEGSNQYYTASRFNTAFSGKSTSDLSEGSNQYFTNSRARSAISATGEISYNSSTGVISKTKRQETYTGTTNSSGLYTVTFAQAYSVTPNVSVTPISGNNKESQVVTTSTSGFTVYIQLRTDVVGLLPSFSNVNGRTVDVLVTEK